MSRPGNEGYALLDALVALAIASLVAFALLPGLSAALRQAARSQDRAFALIEARNEAARIRMGEGR